MSELSLIPSNGQFEISTTGLIISPDVTFEEWQNYGGKLRFAESAIQWLIGDWLNHGELKWGEMRNEAESDQEYQRWKVYKSVAGRVPKVNRLTNLTWSHHMLIAPLPVDEQIVWLERATEKDWSKQELDQALRYERRGIRITAMIADFDATGRYPILYADPPWEYDFPVSGSRKIEQNYPTMSFEEICAMNVPEIAADDAILFLWSVFHQKSLAVMHAWGFEYRTEIAWVKPTLGMGQWVRKRHEFCLIGVRGEPPTPRPEDKPESVLNAPPATDAHSSKPDQMYELIEAMYPELPKLELFATSYRTGWSSWGNQV